MPYLIDSDWLIDHLAGIPSAIELLDGLAQEGLAISVITYMEVYQGVERSPNPEVARAKLTAFLDVSYTERGDTARLISAREVTAAERKAYEEE
jgi:predicted nucleic acid-binding protein